ncbi:unnamed protein product [Triticum turgidum subsp. durum]|uniref:Telomere-associated protein Rif1 N-terminal domain-containing protein n=1 Tax=Triticum turgidum subsp. durum TaxID=4567 RepID=A0A9R0Z6R2_TRITD|nr:unnamed protein product [Triticum turgidum subsp. durum]
MTTKMKAICNLAVWCISVQQLEASVVEDGVTPLLNAIVYALDNPFGSLSTTFEAVQATMKLASQYPKGMRDQSSIWVPPIYRRLLSADKPERDMSERCLIKVSSVILPPQSPLSKEVALDLEQKLLSSVLDMLNDPSKKIQAVKSWGWFISLLGARAASTRPLLNKMLKVPEQLFTDPDPQVQITTMVTWTNLVDAFFGPQALENMDQGTVMSPIEPRAHASAQMKKIRLLLQGVRVQCNSKLADDNAMICITKACKFVKEVFLDMVGKQKSNSSTLLVQFCLQFVKCTVEELDNSLLASGKYELCLDIEQIKEIEYAECSPKLSHPRIRPLAYLELVSPAVYLTALSLSIVAQFTGELSPGDAEQLASIICPPDLLGNFHVVVAFLYMQIMRPVDSRLRIKWLVVWNKVSKRLNEQMMSYLKVGCGASGHDVLCQFFCYPFFALVSPGSISAHWNAENSSEGYLNMTQDLEVELVIEVYRSFCTNSSYCSEPAYMVFLEHFFEYLIHIIDENMSPIQANLKYCLEKKFKNITILSVLGNVVIGLLENAQIFTYANKEIEVTTNEEPAGSKGPNLMLTCLKLGNRFMKLSGLAFKENPAARHQVTSRYFSSLSDFVGHLTSMKDILLLFEIIGDQFTEWLTLSSTSCGIIHQGETIDQLEKLWLNTVTCLTTSRLISDCSFLGKHHLLLQVAVDHPHGPISAATTAIRRSPGSSNAGLRHAGRRSVSKADELSLDRSGKDHNCASDAERAFVLEELNISRMSVAPMLLGRGTGTSNTTDRAPKNRESLRVSAGLGRKRLKIMRYSGKGKGPGKVTDASFSPGWAEGEVCRKPELILEMLKRKR